MVVIPQSKLCALMALEVRLARAVIIAVAAYNDRVDDPSGQLQQLLISVAPKVSWGHAVKEDIDLLQQNDTPKFGWLEALKEDHELSEKVEKHLNDVYARVVTGSSEQSAGRKLFSCALGFGVLAKARFRVQYRRGPPVRDGQDGHVRDFQFGHLQGTTDFPAGDQLQQEFGLSVDFVESGNVRQLLVAVSNEHFIEALFGGK